MTPPITTYIQVSGDLEIRALLPPPIELTIDQFLPLLEHEVDPTALGVVGIPLVAYLLQLRHARLMPASTGLHHSRCNERIVSAVEVPPMPLTPDPGLTDIEDLVEFLLNQGVNPEDARLLCPLRVDHPCQLFRRYSVAEEVQGLEPAVASFKLAENRVSGFVILRPQIPEPALQGRGVESGSGRKLGGQSRCAGSRWISQVFEAKWMGAPSASVRA